MLALALMLGCRVAPNETLSSEAPSPTPALTGAASVPEPTPPQPTADSAAPGLPFNTPRMRVGVFELPPYAMRTGNGEWNGVAVTLFREVSQRLGMRYDWVVYPDMATALTDLTQDKIDFLAVGLDPTPEREAQFDFSHAFEQSGTSVAVRQDHTPSALGIWRQIMNSNLPKMLAWVVGCMVLVALLMTVLERRRSNSHFGGSLLRSFGESLWWSVTTMSTVGYGDRVPVTWRGKILGGTWMLIAFALMSILAGVIASELTVSRFRPEITEVSGLPRLRVGAVTDSAGAMDAAAQGIRAKPFRTLTDALAGLERREIDAVVGDTAALRFMVQKNFARELTVLPDPLVVEYACLPMSPRLGLNVRNAFNYWVLRIIESASWQTYHRIVSGDN
jgi:ABC-type amino acid transport substrate-binding protein